MLQHIWKFLRFKMIRSSLFERLIYGVKFCAEVFTLLKKASNLKLIILCFRPIFPIAMQTRLIRMRMACLPSTLKSLNLERTKLSQHIYRIASKFFFLFCLFDFCPKSFSCRNLFSIIILFRNPSAFAAQFSLEGSSRSEVSLPPTSSFKLMYQRKRIKTGVFVSEPIL